MFFFDVVNAHIHRVCSQMETLFQWIENGKQEITIVFCTRHFDVIPMKINSYGELSYIYFPPRNE